MNRIKKEPLLPLLVSIIALLVSFFMPVWPLTGITAAADSFVYLPAIEREYKELGRLVVFEGFYSPG